MSDHSKILDGGSRLTVKASFMQTEKHLCMQVDLLRTTWLEFVCLGLIQLGHMLCTPACANASAPVGQSECNVLQLHTACLLISKLPYPTSKTRKNGQAPWSD